MNRIKFELKPELLIQPDEEGRTPFFVAIKNRNLSVAQMMLSFLGKEEQKNILNQHYKGEPLLNFIAKEIRKSSTDADANKYMEIYKKIQGLRKTK